MLWLWCPVHGQACLSETLAVEQTLRILSQPSQYNPGRGPQTRVMGTALLSLLPTRKPDFAQGSIAGRVVKWKLTVARLLI